MMDNWKEEFKQYLPTIEEFLTSVLLEETQIAIATSDRVEKESALQHLKKTDILLHATDQAKDADIILVLGQEWYGLLSSIMLGIEEKEKNETTIELLEEFSTDLSDVLLKELEENEIVSELNDVQVLSKSEMQELLSHEQYFWTNMEIEGLADNKVRAEFYVGDPETKVEVEETGDDIDVEEEEVTEISSIVETEDEAFETVGSNGGEPKEGRKEKVVSARPIEFAEFPVENEPLHEEAHSMDLLKDVELDVSVELGRIELPLGKVLQLAKGSVIELEKLAGEPVDILVNGNRIALGEVVVIDEHFGVRISSLVTTKKRLAKLSNGSSE